MNLQNEFLEFHKKIKLDFENQILREKRDILIKKLKNNITEDAPSFEYFDQGSYAMYTGINPKNGDYDIDVGLIFDIEKSDIDPISVKQWVRDALDGHTKSVKIRRSCVTVTYQEKNEAIFHVDFAIYAKDSSTNKLFIAKGKEYSDDSKVLWEVSDPKGLKDKVNQRFQDPDERAQFRRVIKYLKKWKELNSYLSENGTPTGIALTTLAYELFIVSKKYDSLKCKYNYDDMAALINLVRSIKEQFVKKFDYAEQKYYHEIAVNLIVEPHNDLFDKMTHNQMEIFFNEICKLESTLSDAGNQVKKSKACTILSNPFGDDFPINSDRSFVGTSESAFGKYE